LLDHCWRLMYASNRSPTAALLFASFQQSIASEH
jgi:hypothetical protein